MLNKQNYIPGIDSLRALAVLAVIFFHLHDFLLPGGFAGVDVFFVISGYVVTGSLLRSDRDGFSGYIVGFYARRFARIYPALVLCFVVVVAAKTMFVPRAWLSQSSEITGIASLFGFGNVALVWSSDGYFSNRVDFNAFTHTWSLGVEEQFYFIFPLLVYACFKQKVFGSKAKFLLCMLSALALASLLVSWWQSTHDVAKAYYFLFSRFWELAAGACLNVLHSERMIKQPSAKFASLSYFLGIILIFASFVFSDPLAFPFPWAILSVAGTLIAIHGLVLRSMHEQIELTGFGQVMQYLGRISYSLYLWHWPVIVILRWTIGDSGWMYVVLALGLTFFLAILSYHFVEKKINYANVRRAMSDNRIVLSSLASLMALSVLGWGVFKSHSILTMSVTGDHRVWYSAPSVDISTLQGSDKKRLFVLGDSHVGAYSEMLRMLEENNQWDVLSYFRAGCSMADLLKPAQETCKQEMLALVKEVIAKSRPGDAVFLAALRSNRLSDQWFSFKESDIQASVEQTRMLQQESVEQAHGVIELLEKSGLIVILDAPKPVFRSPPFRCSDWFNQMNPVCLSGLTISRDYLVQHNQPVMRAIEQLKQMHPGLKVWDSFPILCTGAYCHAKENGIPMFFDGDHLSGHGNRKLYPYFLEFMGQLRTGSLMNQAHVSAAHE